MKAKISFFDPHTQQPYTTGEEYPLIDDNKHLEWLMQHGLIYSDQSVVGASSPATTETTTDLETTDKATADTTTADTVTADTATANTVTADLATTTPASTGSEKSTKKRDQVTADGDDAAGK